MTFLELQTYFAALTMDTATTWAVAGTNNKASLNEGYEELFDNVKNMERIKGKIFTQKTSVTITSKTGTLPADFDTMYMISTVDFDTNSDLTFDDYDENRYYDYQVKGTIAGAKTIEIQDDLDTLYVSYVPTRADMSLDAAVPVLPQEIHKSIADFAMVDYYRKQRDDIGASNALNLAQQYLEKRLTNFN